MPLDPETLQKLAQNNLTGVQQQPLQSGSYQPYKPPATEQIPDATQPILQRRQELKGLMSDPLSNPQYRAYEDSVNQAGAATRQRATESLHGAADQLAVARELEKYDFQTRALLANRLGDLYGQQQQELGQLAGTEAGLLDTAAGRAQQGNQFNQQLGEQSSQFGFGQQQQGSQFGQELAEKQRQFDTGQESRKNEFLQTLGNRQTEFATNTNLANRALDLKGVGNTVADSFFGGAAGTAGKDLGNWVGSLLGGLSTGGGYAASPGQQWGGVPYAPGQSNVQSTPSFLDSVGSALGDAASWIGDTVGGLFDWF
jgi:hypothetical protein